jgi:hypothetical protein
VAAGSPTPTVPPRGLAALALVACLLAGTLGVGVGWAVSRDRDRMRDGLMDPVGLGPTNTALTLAGMGVGFALAAVPLFGAACRALFG